MEKRRKKTITITSGKGGVGKSSIVSNMAYVLGGMKASTYILDADLSLGNID
ncbi:MAG: P-loop NTPase, partial [Syntrophorhabdus sp.]|nr:P-loop NTPase [Syntrophorhabdus sp.]